jgi:hypothetical protein
MVFGKINSCEIVASLAPYRPHCHPERLGRSVPSEKTICVCGNGDVAFCPPDFLRQIIATIAKKNRAKHFIFNPNANVNVFWFIHKTFATQTSK